MSLPCKRALFVPLTSILATSLSPTPAEVLVGPATRLLQDDQAAVSKALRRQPHHGEPSPDSGFLVSNGQRTGESRVRRALKGEAKALGPTSPGLCVVMSLMAGLSTTVGAVVALLLPDQQVSRGQMAFALALAGGVMLSVTILEFWLPLVGDVDRAGAVVGYSVLGALAFLALSYCVPEPQVAESAKQWGSGDERQGEDARPIGRPYENASDNEEVGAMNADGREEQKDPEKQRKWRLAFVLMLALTAHNFPEGFAVAISALQSDRLGWVVMIAIALHNIPEGISIALPVFSATGNKWKALWMSFLSGMAEPLGAVTALLLVHALGGGLNSDSMENLLCTVGGVMCAVAVKELLPEAWRQQRPGAMALGFFTGFLIMFLSHELGA